LLRFSHRRSRAILSAPDPNVDWVIEASLAAMRNSGAAIGDVRFPKWLLDPKLEFYDAIRVPEFAAQIKDYLATIGPGISQDNSRHDRLDQSLHRGASGRRSPQSGRWTLFKREASSGTLEDYRYTSVRNYYLPLVGSAVEGLFATEKLDAIIYPTATRRLALLTVPPDTAPATSTASVTNIANLTGFPDLIVPAGFTGDNLRARVQRARAFVARVRLRTGQHAARRRPIHAPALKGNRYQCLALAVSWPLRLERGRGCWRCSATARHLAQLLRAGSVSLTITATHRG